MDEFLFISMINILKFEKEEFNIGSEENKPLMEDLKVTPDGKILAVRRSRVDEHLKDKEVFLTRMGMRPFPKKVEIKEESDFWRLMAMLVDIEEDV